MNYWYEWNNNGNEGVNKGVVKAFKSNSLNFSPHLHMEFEMVCVMDGKIRVNVNNCGKTMGPGDACIIPGNFIHDYKTEGNCNVFLALFNPANFPDFNALFKNMSPQSPFCENMDYLPDMALCIEKLLSAKENGCGPMIINGYMSVILGHITDKLVFVKDAPGDGGSLQKILTIIENNIDGELSLDSIAKESGFSKFHISKLFNKSMGCGINRYINMLRVNRAAELLSGDMSVTEICYECGFSNVRSFYRAFGEIHNQTPREMRKKLGSQS